ncbi:YpoC family protein [Ferdinandcohnia quinoae]|uniref:YpoC-like domain-containing protein n=1 Tax=Fredinandcohnia quinoae TaxID=2918902 RepID=A0AAW5E6E5_9BACI|nr:hypothetical protein [Fredinandcohnia sp. SECRCQ15]MCH1624708.1 hypothetical protein [Fredinandcohnia sp. SECRCQ15]
MMDNSDYCVLSVQQILGNWEKEKEFLLTQFNSRKKEGVKESMNISIDSFTHLLCKVNKREWSNLNEILLTDNLDYKPINLYERITFIQKNPSSYHSYIQLGLLYDELAKQYYKNLAIQRQKK